MECMIPECNCGTKKDTNKIGSKQYCQEHSDNGVKVICSICKSEYIILAKNYMKFIRSNKEIICRKCSLIKHNKSKQMIDRARKMGLEYGPITGPINIKIAIKNWSNSEQNLKNISALGFKHAKEWNPSEEGQAHILKLNKSEPMRKQAKQSIIKANEFWNTKEGKIKRKLIIKDSGFRIEFCNICNRETMHVSARCFVCDPWEGGFDRNTFYDSKFSIISFKSEDKIISFNSLDILNGIPGIWSIWSKNKNNEEICLEVCETQNIGKEMLQGIRLIHKGKENLNKTDIEIKESRKNYIIDDSSKRIKYRNIYSHNKYGEIIFKLVKININNKIERQDLEAQYAHDNKALFWNPAPGQNIHM